MFMPIFSGEKSATWKQPKLIVYTHKEEQREGTLIAQQDDAFFVLATAPEGDKEVIVRVGVRVREDGTPEFYHRSYEQMY